MGDDPMEMKINIDDDVFAAAKKIAESEERIVDEVISDLARQSLPRSTTRWEMRNGFPLIPKQAGSKPVTNEIIDALKDDDY